MRARLQALNGLWKIVPYYSQYKKSGAYKKESEKYIATYLSISRCEVDY